MKNTSHKKGFNFLPLLFAIIYTCVMFPLQVFADIGLDTSSVPQQSSQSISQQGSYNSNLYVVTYYVDNKIYHQTTAEKNGKIKDVPKDPIRDGYIFAGWSKSKDSKVNSGIWNFDNDIICSNICLYPSWKRNPNTSSSENSSSYTSSENSSSYTTSTTTSSENSSSYTSSTTTSSENSSSYTSSTTTSSENSSSYTSSATTSSENSSSYTSSATTSSNYTSSKTTSSINTSSYIVVGNTSSSPSSDPSIPPNVKEKVPQTGFTHMSSILYVIITMSSIFTLIFPKFSKVK